MAELPLKIGEDQVMDSRIAVFTLSQLRNLISLGKLVYVPESNGFQEPIAAASMMDLSGANLLRLFEAGMFVYEKPGKDDER
jgi:hypothetical protein